MFNNLFVKIRSLNDFICIIVHNDLLNEKFLNFFWDILIKPNKLFFYSTNIYLNKVFLFFIINKMEFCLINLLL